MARQPLQREWRPGTVSQQVLEILKMARHVAVDERDPNAWGVLSDCTDLYRSVHFTKDPLAGTDAQRSATLMKTVSCTDFRSRASMLFDAVERGETLVVLRHGKPVAEIHPVAPGGPATPSWRKPGLRLAAKGAALAAAILEERSHEDIP